MDRKITQAWRDFHQVISEIDDRDLPITIFCSIRSWYQRNKKLLSPDLIAEYGIEKLISIDPQTYPLNRSECTPQSIRRFLQIEPSSEDSMMMFLRDELWELVVLAVDVQCQNCGKLQMSALFDVLAGEVVLECTQCGSLHRINGILDRSEKSLRFAQVSDLESAGLI